MKEYIAAELEPVTAYPDQTGKLHLRREDAIEANFEADLRGAAYDQIGCADSVKTFLLDLKAFAEEHPDFLRILVGDRSMTCLLLFQLG